MKRQGYVFGPLLTGLLLAGLLLAGCAPATPQPTPTAPTHAPGAATRAAPTGTVPPTLTPTLTVTPSPSPTACAQAHGTLSTQVLDSQLLREELTYALYLPPCYPAGAPPGGYPVLYLLHGQGMDETIWVELGWMDALDRLISSGSIPPLLVVMPREKRELQSPAESKYADVLLNELLPAVEQGYAACARRECRMLGGVSRGAAWAVHIGLQNPGLFAALGAHSLTVFYGDTLATPRWIKAVPAGQMPRLWLDMGDRDRFRQAYDEYARVLKDNGVAFEEHTWPGRHEKAYWSAHVEEYLRWYGGD